MTVVKYNLDDINRVIDLMNTELSITGIQNVKTIANIHEILTRSATVEEVKEEKESAPVISELYNAETDGEEVEVVDLKE